MLNPLVARYFYRLLATGFYRSEDRRIVHGRRLRIDLPNERSLARKNVVERFRFTFARRISLFDPVIPPILINRCSKNWVKLLDTFVEESFPLGVFLDAPWSNRNFFTVEPRSEFEHRLSALETAGES